MARVRELTGQARRWILPSRPSAASDQVHTVRAPTFHDATRMPGDPVRHAAVSGGAGDLAFSLKALFP